MAVVAEAPPRLLLLDLVDVQARQQQQGPPGPDDAGSAPGLVLLPDLAAPERVFVRTATAAWAVTLSWLPALANFLVEGVPLL